MYKLLIVDDDEIICRGLRSCIPWESHGICVIGQAYDGEEALELVERECPDILLADINMPFLDGMELSCYIRQKYPEIKIILLTAYKEFTYARQAVRMQIFEYLTKPFSNDEVLKSVLRAVAVLEKERAYRVKVSKSLESVKKRMQEGVRKRNWEQIQEELKVLFERLSEGKEKNYAAESFRLLELLRSAWEATEEPEAYERFMEQSGSILNKLMEAGNLMELAEIAEKYFGELCDYLELLNTTDIERRVNQAVKYIRENYPNPELSLEEVARTVNLSSSYLGNCLKKYKNISYVNLLNQVRIEQAKKLLGRLDVRTYEVAFLVGYNSSQYFSSCFKKATGVTPGVYREQALKGSEGGET